MFAAYGKNTMRNAKFKFRDPADAPVVRNMAQIRQERFAREAEEYRERLLREKEEKLQREQERRQRAIARIEEAHELAKASREIRIPVRDIIRAVAAEHNVTYEDIVGPRRNRWIVPIRFEAVRRVADLRPDLGMPRIGRAFNRDHTTILHALRKTSKTGKLRG